MSQAKTGESVKNVVLVHGGFVDGSGWLGVYDLLKKDGYNVSIVQNPTTSLADDVAVTKRTLAVQNGPAILVGHSLRGRRGHGSRQRSEGRGPRLYRGVRSGQGRVRVGVDQTRRRVRLSPRSCRLRTAICFSNRTKFRASFAADVSADAAAFMADSQVPWGLDALNGVVSEPAWKSKPSWYLVSTEDKMIPPDAQRAMSKRAGSTVTEVKGSHSVYVSQPQAVAAIIAKAATGVTLAAK